MGQVQGHTSVTKYTHAGGLRSTERKSCCCVCCQFLRGLLSRQPCERLLSSSKRQLLHEGAVTLLGKVVCNSSYFQQRLCRNISPWGGYKSRPTFKSGSTCTVFCCPRRPTFWARAASYRSCVADISLV